jgi:CRP-like cAMP-binding protein
MNRDSKVAGLTRCWLFRGLNTDQIGEIADLAEPWRYGKDEFVLHEGDPPDLLNVIVSGNVKQFKASLSGEPLTTIVSSIGSALQVEALFGAESYFFSAQTINETTVLAVMRADFLSFVERHPAMKDRILVKMGMMVDTAYERLVDFVGERAYRRVLNVMYVLSCRFPDTAPFSLAEIADLATTSLDTTARVIRELETARIVEWRKEDVIVVDRMQLREYCRKSYAAGTDPWTPWLPVPPT